MAVSSLVMVDGPAGSVDPQELFAAAARVAGARAEGARVFDCGEVHLLRAEPGQGAQALVSVHYAANNGAYPADEETGQPPGQALVSFNTDGYDLEAVRPAHAGIVAAFGGWLSERGHQWSSQFEDEPWTHGSPADTAGADEVDTA